MKSDKSKQDTWIRGFEQAKQSMLAKIKRMRSSRIDDSFDEALDEMELFIKGEVK